MQAETEGKVSVCFPGKSTELTLLEHLRTEKEIINVKVLVTKSRTDTEENKMCKNSMLKFQVGKTQTKKHSIECSF